MQTRSKDYSKKYVKLVSKKEIRDKYRLGKNTDVNECGLYFTDIKNAFNFMNYNDGSKRYLAIVRPIGDIVNVNNHFKANELWIDEFLPIEKAIPWLVSEGASTSHLKVWVRNMIFIYG